MYVIKHCRLGFIAGFNADHLTVVHAETTNYARKFTSKTAAQRFIDRYSNAGYGLQSDDCSIELLEIADAP